VSMESERDADGGRRAYDAQSPLIELMEQRILRAFDQQLRETRHMLREELASLAVQVRENTLKSTEEHGQVKVQLAELRTEITELRPLKQTVAELKSSDDADHARDNATHELRRTLWKASAVLAGLILTAAGLILASLH
jgi:DNA-binding transcriptional MerR regulator